MRWTVHQASERGIPAPLAVALARRREPLARYQAIARELGERCQIVLARVHGEPAASVIVLLGGVHAHYWRATSDRGALGRSYANHLALARVLERACSNGCHYLHMGESGGKASLIQFKEHFGAEPVSYDELRLGPVGMTLAVRARERAIQRAGIIAIRAAARVH
jgi:hypothetical protein